MNFNNWFGPADRRSGRWPDSGREAGNRFGLYRIADNRYFNKIALGAFEGAFVRAAPLRFGSRQHHPRLASRAERALDRDEVEVRMPGQVTPTRDLFASRHLPSCAPFELRAICRSSFVSGPPWSFLACRSAAGASCRKRDRSTEGADKSRGPKPGRVSDTFRRLFQDTQRHFGFEDFGPAPVGQKGPRFIERCAQQSEGFRVKSSHRGHRT